MTERVAVIGMAFRFPGAETPEEYWRIIRHGRTLIRRFTDTELAAAGVPAERYRRPDFVGAGAMLDDIAGFDAPFFRVSTREALITDPQQRIFLECAYHALENAGYPQESAGSRIGVYASTGYHLYAMQTYLLNNALQDTEADNWLSRMETMVGNHPDFTATRAAFRLGLTGPAVNVQTACSSSLVAVQLAARSVLAGDCDIALAGAAALHVPKVLGYHYVKGSILSKSGQLRPFDAAADGTVGGMGVAAVVLKDLERAVADGDTVHGVIRGSGVANDGAAKTAYTAPSAEGQYAAIRRALTTAGSGADSIGYVEMHGTGTLKGDPVEFEAATSAFRQDTSRTAYCGIGSVKGNIGHLDVCAGIAGLIKVLLVLKHGVIPPVAGFSRANPALDVANSPFYIPRQASPWPRASAPRVAGLTSLGVGGTNVHLVVEEAPARKPRPRRVPPAGLVLVSGRDDASLRANVQALRDHLRESPGTGMADLVTTTLSGRVHFPRRLAVQGQTPAEIADALGSWLGGGRADKSAQAHATSYRVAFIFSGQGVAREGMAAALHERFARVRATLRDFEHRYQDSYGESLLGWLTADRPAGTPPDTATEQPALFALQHAITLLWRDAGVVPDVTAGHSVGEYAALCAAGAISAQDGLRLTAERGRLMRRRCPPGAMVAVASDRLTAERLAAQVAGVELAVVSGQERHVLAGPHAAIERLCAILTDRNISGERLPVAHAFHTSAMEDLLPEFRSLLLDVAFKPVTMPFISGLDGRLRQPGWTPDPDYFLRHTREPVRFDEVLRALRDGDFAALLEIGPKTGPDAMSDAAARLHCAGADIDWQVLLEGRAAQRARGSWLEDVDGNRYVDITMGFGALLFGHEPGFVSDAIKAHLSDGLRLGPRAAETGEAAELLAALTGMQRVAFAVSGTEANSASIRLARAATGRSKIVIFSGSYHGHADNVLGRSAGGFGAERRTVPVSAGIPASAVADLLVLDYGEPASLEVIEEFAGEIAVVVVEPVQSRNPSPRPVEFVRKLRDVTRDHGIVLMFDEMLTGLRFAPGGAQEFYGVRADIATYGKALGGGFPIGAIAGRSDIMDGVDGGFWKYGDDSCPHADTTFFGGTYIQHPVAMTAAKAVLTHLTESGPELQRRLNERTNELAGALNRFFEAEDFPLRMHNFGSMFRFEHRADMDLLYHHLMLSGVHVWEWRNFFLSTAHSDDDIEFIAGAVRESLRELRGAGFFPAATRTAERTAERLPAMPLNTAAVPRQPRRTPDFSIYFFGDYPRDETPRDGKYELIADVARFADEHGFHALWMPERHFHSFGGLFPNPAVLASALARETRRIRLNAGSVVLPLHDPIRVAEEWSMVDNLSGGRIGIGCAGGLHAGDFVFFPDRFGRHKELVYEQVEVVRTLWRGEKIQRRTGDGEREVQLFPRPVQAMPPMFTAVVGNPASYEAAARHDMGVITNLMSQSVEQLAENIARYRRARGAHGLDPDAGRVAVLLHTYLAADHDSARREAYDPMRRYMKASMALFGSFTNSLGYRVDMASLDEDDLDVLFRRAYERYCDQRALIGAVETAASVVDAVRAAGADEIVSLVDFGVAPDALRSGLTHLDRLRQATCELEEAGPSEDTAPLSAAQWRLWFIDRMSADVRACNELKAVRLDGPLDVPALHTALRRLVQRHEQLRTVVRQTRGEPRQLPLSHAEPDFAVVDRPAAAGASEDAVVREVVAAEGSRRFDLENGPLFVTRLVAVGKDRHVLVMCLHHIIVDAVSLAIMIRDLSALYQAEREHAPAELPVTSRSYSELSQATRDERETTRCLDYWRQVLGGDLPVLDLPCDRPRPAELTFGGGNVFRALDAELSDELRGLSRTHQCTTFMTLLAGYAAMLHHATGQDDIIIGTPVSRRPSGAENVVGLFLNPVALRLDLSGDPGFGTLLSRVRRAVVDACDHVEVPFETVVREIAPRRVGNRTPIFQTYAEYESGEPFRFDLPGVRATVLEQAPGRALTDLTMYFIDQPDGIRAHLQYNVNLFDAATAQRLLDRFLRILRHAVHGPDAPLSELAAGGVPPAWERGPVTPIEEITVHEMIARRAEQAPDRPAVVYGETTLTYGELDEQAGRFAAAITERFGEPSPDRLIALWLPPSPELILAMVGVLKAGYGFLPLDPWHRRSAGAGRAGGLRSAGRGTRRVACRAAATAGHGGVRRRRTAVGAGQPHSGGFRWKPGLALLRHLHLRQHRKAQGRRDLPSQSREHVPMAAPLVRLHRRRPQRAAVQPRLRRVRARDLASADRGRLACDPRSRSPAGSARAGTVVRGDRSHLLAAADRSRRGGDGHRTTAAAAAAAPRHRR